MRTMAAVTNPAATNAPTTNAYPAVWMIDVPKASDARKIRSIIAKYTRMNIIPISP